MKLNKHLKDVDETYFEHMYHALTYAFTFAILTCTTLVHSILPFLFVETGSKKIRSLHNHMHNRLDNEADKDTESRERYNKLFFSRLDDE